jgi:hypothetical protein
MLTTIALLAAGCAGCEYYDAPQQILRPEAGSVSGKDGDRQTKSEARPEEPEIIEPIKTAPNSEGGYGGGSTIVPSMPRNELPQELPAPPFEAEPVPPPPSATPPPPPASSPDLGSIADRIGTRLAPVALEDPESPSLGWTLIDSPLFEGTYPVGQWDSLLKPFDHRCDVGRRQLIRGMTIGREADWAENAHHLGFTTFDLDCRPFDDKTPVDGLDVKLPEGYAFTGFSVRSCFLMHGARVCGFKAFANSISKDGAVDDSGYQWGYSDEISTPSDDEQRFDCPKDHVLVGLKGLKLRDRYDYEPTWVGGGQVYKITGVCARVQPNLHVMTPSPEWTPPLEATPNGNYQQITVLKDEPVEGPTEARYYNRLNP